MIVDEKVTKVARSKDFEESTFKIKTSAKAFEILSSGLYSDIILAVVRELSTNAWDSHVEADTTDKQFVVHLPNSMEPHFSIRDYGTGLSREDVEELYTTYFHSSKTSSNDLNGCLGLGSKSPFAYTDSFQVISYFNGKKYMFNLFKGEEGFPKVAMLAEVPTDEPNGLEIIIAVKEEDFHKFVDKANILYPYFSSPPKVIGNVKAYNGELPEPLHEGSFWKILPPSGGSWRYDNKSYAVMGNIAYPIRINEIDAPSNIDLIRANRFIIEFPIGELEISANREELQWEEKTKAAISKRVNLVIQELVQKLEKLFEDCKSLWEARLLYGKYFSHHGSMYSLSYAFNNTPPKWKGQEISVLTDIRKLEGVEFKELYCTKQRTRLVCSSNNDIGFINATEKCTLIYNDLPKGGLQRVRKWFKQDPDCTKKTIYLVEFEKPGLFKQVHKTLGTDKSHWIAASSLPKPAKAKRTKSSLSTMFLWNPMCSNWTQLDRCWVDEQDVDYSNVSGVYIPIRRWKIVDDKGEDIGHPGDIRQLYEALKQIDKAPDKIYGIRWGSLNKVKKANSKWISFFDYAEKEYKAYVKKHKLKKIIGKKKAYSTLSHTQNILNINKALMRKYPSMRGCDINVLAEEIHKTTRKFSAELTKALNLLDNLPRTTKLAHQPSTDDSILLKEMEILDKYPLIKQIIEPECYHRFSGRKFDFNHFADYIYLIETGGTND